jgi:enoyl-CoA hydratase/carnithine racemase
MGLIHVERHDQVAVLKLNRGVTNALNSQLLDELAENLRQVKDDSAVRALALGSANDKFFSIGLDIPALYGLARLDFSLFCQTFDRVCLDLYTWPGPTVAAISGHATAGGCILALCCDYRFIAEGRKLMGLNEVKLGVPVPYPADCILRRMVGAPNAREVMDTGAFYPPEKLLQMGMVDQVLPLDQVLPKAIEKARLEGVLPGEAFGLSKRSRVGQVEAQILEHLAEQEQLFVERWYSEETRGRLREAMKKF